MFAWHHWLDGHEFEQALGVGDGQGSLVCYNPWGCRVRHGQATELTDSIKYFFTCRVISEVNAGSERVNSPQSQ